MADRERKIFDGLAALGAGDFKHLDSTLERHLVAVHDLLQAWGADDSLCRAGLYHAAYGTAGFEASMVSHMQRSRIAALIGPAAEQTVYDYCACARQTVWPQIESMEEVDFLDRFTGNTRLLAGDELRSFCELTCANEVEIAIHDTTFAKGAGRHLGRLFARWDRHLSASARQAAASSFNQS